MSVPASSTEEEDISQLRLEGDESDESSTGEPEEDDDAKDLEETIQSVKDALNPIKWYEKATGKTVNTEPLDKITQGISSAGSTVLSQANRLTDQVFDGIDRSLKRNSVIVSSDAASTESNPETVIPMGDSEIVEIGANNKKASKRKKKRSSNNDDDNEIIVHHKSGVLGLFQKVATRLKPILEENVAKFSYDNTHNNWLGADFTCIDPRLCGSCIIHDEVRLGTWLLGLSAVVCFVVFVLVHSVLQNVSSDSIENHPHFVALMIALPFVIVATLLTIIQIINHQRNWVHTASQRQIIRIVLMCPIYAWASWLSLYFLELSVYIDFVRVCYEAYVIYSFLLLLTKYLGGRDSVALIIRHKPPLSWPQPFCCFPKVNPNKQFLLRIKYGVLQYVIITPLLAMFAGVANWFDEYGDGEINWDKGYPYVALIQNFSQITSLYCLVWFYVVTQAELMPFKPVAKFVVVKSVVFFTFWQSVGLALCVKWGWLTGTAGFSTGEVQVGLQNFIICIEMFITAIGHRYIFGHEEYADGSLKVIMTTRLEMWKEQSSGAYASAVNAIKKSLKPDDKPKDPIESVIIAADAVQSVVEPGNIRLNTTLSVASNKELLVHSPMPDNDEFEGSCLVDDDNLKDDDKREEMSLIPMTASDVLGKSLTSDSHLDEDITPFDFSSVDNTKDVPHVPFKELHSHFATGGVSSQRNNNLQVPVSKTS